jgi:hypothetical protein
VNRQEKKFDRDAANVSWFGHEILNSGKSCKRRADFVNGCLKAKTARNLLLVLID